MKNSDTLSIGPHDLGGSPAGALDRAEHDVAYWERQVDAMVILMFRKGLFSDAAQLRLGIESLGPDVYEKLSYYERWAASAAHQALARGVVTAEELEARVEKLRLEGART
jgi:hypothetical protein